MATNTSNTPSAQTIAAPMGRSTGGQREFIPVLSRAAVAAGVAGIFIEVHENPAKALSDGRNSLALRDVPAFLKMVMKIDKLIKRGKS